jgi:hypothetical protein
MTAELLKPFIPYFIGILLTVSTATLGIKVQDVTKVAEAWQAAAVYQTQAADTNCTK